MLEFYFRTNQYRDHIIQGGIWVPGRMPPTPIECPECSMRSAFRAVKCKECETIFMQDYTSEDFPDRCPKCDYSDIEVRRNKARK